MSAAQTSAIETPYLAWTSSSATGRKSAVLKVKMRVTQPASMLAAIRRSKRSMPAAELREGELKIYSPWNSASSVVRNLFSVELRVLCGSKSFLRGTPRPLWFEISSPWNSVSSVVRNLFSVELRVLCGSKSLLRGTPCPLWFEVSSPWNSVSSVVRSLFSVELRVLCGSKSLLRRTPCPLWFEVFSPWNSVSSVVRSLFSVKLRVLCGSKSFLRGDYEMVAQAFSLALRKRFTFMLATR